MVKLHLNGKPIIHSYRSSEVFIYDQSINCIQLTSSMKVNFKPIIRKLWSSEILKAFYWLIALKISENRNLWVLVHHWLSLRMLIEFNLLTDRIRVTSSMNFNLLPKNLGQMSHRQLPVFVHKVKKTPTLWEIPSSLIVVLIIVKLTQFWLRLMMPNMITMSV